MGLERWGGPQVSQRALTNDRSMAVLETLMVLDLNADCATRHFVSLLKAKAHWDANMCLVPKALFAGRNLDEGSKFRRNFTKFGNFGDGRKKNPKFCNTLIHVLYNFRLNFLLFILHIFVFNRCVVINHTNICLDLNVFLEKTYFMC